MEITKSLAGMFSDKKEEKRQISFEVDLVVGKFNLVEEAKRQAQLGLPSFHEKKISSKEKEVVDYLDRNRKKYTTTQKNNSQQNIANSKIFATNTNKSKPKVSTRSLKEKPEK